MIEQMKFPNGELTRPDIRLIKDNAPKVVVAVVQDCWAENPDSRPSIAKVKDAIKEISDGL